MKKNVLSLSITAAVLTLGLAGGAHAVTDLKAAVGTATDLSVAPNGIGHLLVVPYYTANGANKTQINIVNTDTTNGKAVKIRFRSAANSDDVFDFQLFLSPGDVWSGEVSQDTATGLAKMASGDASCTKPSIKAALAADLLFKTDRLDNTSPLATNTTRAASTREGYVEILTMADIAPNDKGIYPAIKHVGGVAPCGTTTATATAWKAINTDLTFAELTDKATVGFSFPSGGLVANWTILNTATSAAYGGTATALVATKTNKSAFGNLAYYPQSKTAVTSTQTELVTADPLLRTIAPLVTPLMVDLPDLSTPYIVTDAAGTQADPIAAANRASAALARTSVSNEFLTTTSINASTDWTFSMPTRRYGVVFDYVAGKALFNDVGGKAVSSTETGSDYFTFTNAKVDAARRMVCVNGVTPNATDREENMPDSVVFSPSKSPTLCGEVSVLSVNNALSAASNSLLAVATLNDVDATYREGWLSVATPGLGKGLPIIGHSFVRAFTGTINIGAAYAHR